MKGLVERLAGYAEYHRDRRNIATHFVGIPAILVGTQAALKKVGIGPLNLANAATGAAATYYRALDPKLGAATAAFLAATNAAGSAIAAVPFPGWAIASGSLIVGGWAMQLLGHWFEGRKPAFLDDLMSLLDGPLFLVAETAFALGLSPELEGEIERRVGPTRWGRIAPDLASVA